MWKEKPSQAETLEWGRADFTYKQSVNITWGSFSGGPVTCQGLFTVSEVLSCCQGAHKFCWGPPPHKWNSEHTATIKYKILQVCLHEWCLKSKEWNWSVLIKYHIDQLLAARRVKKLWGEGTARAARGRWWAGLDLHSMKVASCLTESQRLDPSRFKHFLIKTNEQTNKCFHVSQNLSRSRILFLLSTQN